MSSTTGSVGTFVGSYDDEQLVALSFTGAGAVVGHTGNGASGAPSVGFDAVAADSVVFGAGFTWKNAQTTTAPDGQTVLHAVVVMARTLSELGGKAFEAIDGADLLKTVGKGGVLSEKQLQNLAKAIITMNSDAASAIGIASGGCLAVLIAGFVVLIDHIFTTIP